jgi:hypothetical protein
MKVATIVPQNYLHLIRNDDYFMCLGNLIDAPGMEKYTKFFKARCAEKKFVIMDNGLIENDPRPLDELAKKAVDLGVNEMVMTDVFRDKDRTLKAIAEGMEQIRSVIHPRLMLVPQGNTVEEWIECTHQIILRYNPAHHEYTIGVPKVLAYIGGRDGRISALLGLMDKCPIARHQTFHLLGCWTTPLEITMIDKLTRQGNFPNVRGVDSSMPFVYARAGKGITSQDRPDSEPINFEKTAVNPLLLRNNVRLWRNAADSSSRFGIRMCDDDA